MFWTTVTSNRTCLHPARHVIEVTSKLWKEELGIIIEIDSVSMTFRLNSRPDLCYSPQNISSNWNRVWRHLLRSCWPGVRLLGSRCVKWCCTGTQRRGTSSADRTWRRTWGTVLRSNWHRPRRSFRTLSCRSFSWWYLKSYKEIIAKVNAGLEKLMATYTPD